MSADSLETMLRWVARRAVLGEPIGVGVVASRFGIDAESALLVMGGGWGRYMAQEREVIEELQRRECRHCGEFYRSPAARLAHERVRGQGCDDIAKREPEVLPTVCPRCGTKLYGSYGERFCFVHGTVYTPMQPWDLGSMGVPAADAKEQPLEKGDGDGERQRAKRPADRGRGVRQPCAGCGRVVTPTDLAWGHADVCDGKVEAAPVVTVVGSGPPPIVARRLAEVMQAELGRRWSWRELAVRLYGSTGTKDMYRIGSVIKTLRVHGWEISAHSGRGGYVVEKVGRMPGERVLPVGDCRLPIGASGGTRG